MGRVVSMVVMRTVEFGERCARSFSYGTAVTVFGTDGGRGFVYWSRNVGRDLGFSEGHCGVVVVVKVSLVE